ncbi:DDE-type integrase/transposase/recombinase [Spirosoma spitsbergense]|uniref:DDE-type integrase/transposase/recombinase n=1 Tax=Spirosoma spitsbergense TaxID=431554 RepID=UPI00146C902A|nr:DDE-type integrase/transposase/recombinase [Spirosoma spitsbergense]
MGRLPSIRTLQLWFKAAGLTKPRPQLLNSPKVWAEYPHQVWQVDAKEQQRTLDGTKVCWLTVVDEKSGAVLAAPVFPYGRIGQVPLGLICEQLQLIFRQWGLPQAIKIDNGRPFGDPKRLQIPLLPLWLVGYGIEPIWNRAARPTDNAKVERAQATTANWADLATCSDIADLRQKLAQVIVTQRERYPVRRLNEQTRQQAYPTIDTPLCLFEISHFDYQLVLAFLQRRSWHRKVSKIGVISFYYQRWFLNRSVADQWVSIRLEATSNEWVIFTDTGEFIKSFSNTVITEQALLSLATSQTNSDESC